MPPRSARKSTRRSDSPDEVKLVTRSARKSSRRSDSPDELVELPDRPLKKTAASKAATPKKQAAPPKSPAVKATTAKLKTPKKTPVKEQESEEEVEAPAPKIVPRRSARKAAQLSVNEYNDIDTASPKGNKFSTPVKKSKDGEGDWSAAPGFFWGRDSIGPLFLMTAPPIFIFVLWYLQFHCGGSLQAFYTAVTDPNFTFYGDEKSLIPSPFDPTAWKMIIGYSAFELALMKLMPGEEFRASLTPKGNTPIYIANGFQCFSFTLAVLAGIMVNKQMNPESVYDPSLVYDKFGNILASLNILAFALCFFLTFKGKNFPSTSDSGTTGNPIVDFYWGTELYPRVFGWDIKVFTNCRFGMMYWAVGICCYAYKQFDMIGFVSDSMAISVFLQLVYIAKFFYWETGYFCSMDIQHDRAGYYLCWGCMLWVPAVYASQSFYLVSHPVQLSHMVAVFNLVAGVFCTWINYDADRQRQNFRKVDGKCEIWGRSPVVIKAKYKTKDESEDRTSLLLASGWWGISRHFHYIPEIAAAFFWTVPFACEGHIIPFFYVIYLTILLFDRAFRDDARCAAKYGEYWKEYCGKVPYKIIPGVV